jgi:SNF2 family DNA or RNA helicase
MAVSSSMKTQELFEGLIYKRMLRFNHLLENAKFQFKQYQYDGVKWCIENELRPNLPRFHIRGGIIADEMGLGKTITMIGTMYANFLPHTLIVMPPVLIKQWFNEIYRTSGHKALVYYGALKKNITQNDVNSALIVLTSYNMLMEDNCLLKNLNWNRVIFDEAHHLRNSNTKRFHSCKEIKARIHWLVTGTPIQNKRKDFYNLCNIAGMHSSFYKDPENLRIIGRKFVLRRTKSRVGIELPPVNKTAFMVDWSNNKEMNLAEEIHSLLPGQTYVSSTKRRQIVENFGRGGHLIALLRARQICILPLLIKSLKCGVNTTSKLDLVINLILSRKDNEKGKIVFCHYQEEIDVIASRLLAGGMEKIVKYDGRNSGGKNLDKIGDKADVLIMQIQTGCEGLNLQQNFSEIYFISPHWNPFVEDQAIARCHRIGQTKQVDVFKFEMNGFTKNEDNDKTPISMETYVNQVQSSKRYTSATILGE